MSTLAGMDKNVKKNTQAIASLVLGILSIIVIPIIDCVPLVAALLALVAGVRGLRAARELDGRGRNLAIAGMIIGGVGLLVSIVLFVVAFMQPLSL